MRKIYELIDVIKETVESHKLENEGEYARYLWQNPEQTRKMGINEYGCADAVNILYTINEFPSDVSSRAAHIKVLQDMQEKDTGLFREDTHHYIHTTAHCTAALELFDAKPLYKFKALEEYKTPEGVVALLESLPWEKDAWGYSHRGAGIYAALKLNGETTEEWEKVYFDWMWKNADPEYGYWKKGVINKQPDRLCNFMGGGFHYLFNHEYAHMPLRYPEKVIDMCLDIYENDAVGDIEFGYDGKKFGRYIGFLEIDWVYSITRSLRQSGHRREDCMAALRKFSKNYIDWLYSLNYKTHDGFNDLHMLFGTTCALAELQAALPGEILTRKPLRLVLDRRPFI